MAIFVFFFIKIEVEKPDKKMTFSQEFGWVKIIIFLDVCMLCENLFLIYLGAKGSLPRKNA